MLAWKLENDVNNFVQQSLETLGLRKLKDFNEESAMSDYLKEALRGAAKTKNKTNFGKPDFHCEKYAVPVIIENKFNLNKLIAQTKNEIKFDEKSISGYAVNGALYYARQMIASEKYNDVIAVGVAGDNTENVQIEIYYVYGSNENAFKKMPNNTFDFLCNGKAFTKFLEEARLTEAEKHCILIDSREKLQTYASNLNVLMNNHNITASQRVLYVSGMLLSMQDIKTENGKHVQDGLTPDDLAGLQTNTRRDAMLITNQIDEFLTVRGIEQKKRDLMMASFSEISKDIQRDEPRKLDKLVSKLLKDESSTTKQIFTYIYENIFLAIDGFGGHLDIMGELYSEFLKYAVSDGGSLGIVLTPPYVTKMMAEILNVNQNSRVMDLVTGSSGFLISAMELMIDDVENTYGKQTDKAKAKIEEVKKNQLLGVELNAEMYTLAATNMILRGDGSSKIEKGDSFTRPESLYTDFNADRLLLNPPFKHEEKGMPFLLFGLDRLQKGGLGAIIIQDSAGTGEAETTNKMMLKKHTMIASIKMPGDLFNPMAGVQTSIYIFEAHKPHDFGVPVKFIDFRNDGYKRTKRNLQEIDNPVQRYQEIIKIYKAGKSAKVDSLLWNLDEIYVEDLITSSGVDWNFDQHKKIDTKPTLVDFKKTVSDYLAWEVSQILTQNAPLDPK